MNINIDGFEVELICGICGKELTLDDFTEKGALLSFDPGEIRYPKEPDEPAAFWLECWNCAINQHVSVDELDELAEGMGMWCTQ
jgi:hypothetical protein